MNSISRNNIVCRLSQYRTALLRFKMLGFNKVFSPYLADTVGVSSAVVRKDFSVFGISGNKRGGFIVDDLIAQIETILGKNKVLNVVLAGAGNLGKALMRYGNFAREGIRIIAAFDSDPSKCSDRESPPVLLVDGMEDYIRANGIRVGIIAVPDMAAQQVAEIMARAGIVGILNFAPIQPRVPQGCTVRNVNLALEIDALAYHATSSSTGENALPGSALNSDVGAGGAQ